VPLRADFTLLLFNRNARPVAHKFTGNRHGVKTKVFSDVRNAVSAA
jgi:hypothetical protein